MNWIDAAGISLSVLAILILVWMIADARRLPGAGSQKAGPAVSARWVWPAILVSSFLGGLLGVPIGPRRPPINDPSTPAGLRFGHRSILQCEKKNDPREAPGRSKPGTPACSCLGPSSWAVWPTCSFGERGCDRGTVSRGQREPEGGCLQGDPKGDPRASRARVPGELDPPHLKRYAKSDTR
jgi:hypothetical protein